MIKSFNTSFLKEQFYKNLMLLFLMLFFVLYLYISNEIVWILYVVFLLILTFSRMKFVLLHRIALLILALPLTWGLLMSLDNDLLNTAKGFFYLSIPLIMLMIGYQMSKIYSLKKYFAFIIFAGNIMALIFIIGAVVQVGFKAFLSPYSEARFVVGSGSPLCVLSLVLALFSRRFNLSVFRSKTGMILTIILNLAALYLFASRTYWVMFVIFMFFFSLRTMKKVNLFFIISIFLGSFIILSVIINSISGLSFSNSLLFKLVNSFSEIRITEFKSHSEIYSFYRGYESYMSWVTYSEGNLPELIFGGGFGQMIDLKVKVLLAGIYWDSVPWVHNGFFYVLVKEGALGLIFVILFFLHLAESGIRFFNAKSRTLQFLCVLILSCGASMFMTNFVDCGLYNLEMSAVLITIGYVLNVLNSLYQTKLHESNI
jgi:hypothetical protein